MNLPFPENFNYMTNSFPENGNNRVIHLTPEEIAVLKECNTEGIQKRGIPLGIAFGFVSHIVSKKWGILNHNKWGTIPLTISFALTGYFTGRLTYFPKCYQRLLNVPNGSIRNKILNMKASMESNAGNVPVQVDPNFSFTQTKPTDIELRSTSDFDILPSNLDIDTPHLPAEQSPSATPKQYTTYEELREKNRREYVEKSIRSGYSQVQPGYSSPQSRYPSTQPGYPGQPGHSSQQPDYPLAQSGQEDNFVPPKQLQAELPQRGQPLYQRTRVPAQPGEAETTSGQWRKTKTKYGDDWEY